MAAGRANSLSIILDNSKMYEEFYETMDNRLNTDESMNLIFFGPVSTFMRLDSETLLHILHHTQKEKITIARALLAWDMITGNKKYIYLIQLIIIINKCTYLNYLPMYIIWLI